LLEDLHWGDASTLRLVDGALDAGDAPLCVLATARPELDETFPDLWKDRALIRIGLRPLDRRAAEAMVVATLGGGAAGAAVVRMVELAAGNAFFLEELARARAAGEDRVAGSVLALLADQLAHLPEAERRALRAASVFGERVSSDGVRALLGEAAR